MCLALYIASEKALPLIPWNAATPAFHVIELKPKQERVRAQFSHPHVYYVGSHEGCGCPFNYGREYPDDENEPAELAAAQECVTRLNTYLSAHKVMQIYACQFNQEHHPRKHERDVTPEALRARDFVFQDRELLSMH